MSRAPIAMEKRRGGLAPADAYAQQQYDALPDNVRLNVRVSKLSAKGKEEREGARGLWWAGLTLLSQNTENQNYDTARKAHETILRGLGFVRPRFRIDGSVVMDPVSTSDTNMDDEEFTVLQERARAYVIAEFGFDPWAMWVEEQEAAEAARKARQ